MRGDHRVSQGVRRGGFRDPGPLGRPETKSDIKIAFGKCKAVEEAKGIYEEIIRWDPSDQKSLCKMIELYFLLSQKENALALGKQILKERHNPTLLVVAGGIFANHQYSNMAFAFFTTALQYNPAFKEGYLELGKWFGNKEEYNRAIVTWQEGLKLDPGDQRFKDLIIQAKKLRVKKKAQD